jgi:hypothetical protein
MVASCWTYTDNDIPSKTCNLYVFGDHAIQHLTRTALLLDHWHQSPDPVVRR